MGGRALCPSRPRRTSSQSVLLLHIFLFSCRKISLAPRLEHVPVALCSSLLILPSLLIPVKSIDVGYAVSDAILDADISVDCRARFTGFQGLFAVMS